MGGVAGRLRAIIAVAATFACCAGYLAAAAPASATSPPPPDRYSLVHGCYALQPSAGGFVQQVGSAYDAGGTSAASAERFRMQATDLGSYLLYGLDRDFLAAGDGDSVAVAPSPSDASDWKVVAAGKGFELRNVTTDRPLVRAGDGTIAQGAAGQSDATTRFDFVATNGCPEYPEISLNVSGKPLTGSTPYTQTVGLADMHNHPSAFEFLGGRAHCGKPWDRFGVQAALVDCPDHYPDGRAAILENLFYGDPTRTHDPVGWATFRSWPAYDSLTHEQTYWRWIERAWMGGERLMVANLVENGVLCRTYPYKQNSCDEMDAVHLQAARMHQLQDYIDAQSGGPGKGFFRIVRNPFQARRVINRGKLAIVLGIEESELFGCTEYMDVPQCTLDDVKDGIKEVKKLGVSSFYPIHKFDNAFGGTRFDAGPVGAVINGGQFELSGHFWEVEPCAGNESDNTIATSPPASLAGAADSLQDSGGGVIDAGMATYLKAPQPPVYPPGPHCNVRGLTDLGHKLINLMVDDKLLVEVDHMSVKARDAALKILQDRHYSGVLSGHEWSDKHSYKPIIDLGGMVGGRADDVEGFVDDWKKYSRLATDKYFFGWGYGPDANGLGKLPGPSTDDHPVVYPFKTYRGNVTIDRQVSGERTFDVNTDGTAHYGLLPDWAEDLRLGGGDAIARDMYNGSEAYLETWERAYGVATESCRSRKAAIDRRGFRQLTIRRPAFNVLKQGGQPTKRDGGFYSYCVKGGKGKMLVAFSKRGRAGLIASSAPHHSAGSIGVGDPQRAVAEVARQVSPGVWVERKPPGNRRFVYVTKNGKVGVVGVASLPAGHSKATLKRYLKPLR